MSLLANKIALVTGASKGIGAGIAKALAQAGATVAVNYSSSKAGADKVVAEIQAAGGKAVALQGDFSKQQDITRVYAAIREQFGRLDVLVNNAGVYAMMPLEQVTAEEFHRQFGLNVLGLLLSTQAALPLFGPEGGSIINIGSVVATMAPPNSAIYSGTKGAVDSITISLSKELGARKIRVNSLNPGMVETEGATALGFIDGDFAKQVAAMTPLGRIGQPDDIAKIAVFLASDMAGWVNGQQILAAGGQTM
ncbi:SDR family NAD(P)-dependent oxidoreductase [Acidisphaera sp. L21]|uniref:SDR family NAD(P)-dependent oxidoreductase n=1 Tax=Acidisphaera sp. L21 TaxID=1641851 RepID=UPI00131ACF66|nr:glucose 1-dehydrogenase [Acidisphaera sp. L21]